MATPHKEVFYVRYGVTSEMGLHRFLLPFMLQNGSPADFPVFPPS